MGGDRVRSVFCRLHLSSAVEKRSVSAHSSMRVLNSQRLILKQYTHPVDN
jgi:hypothetical protein